LYKTDVADVAELIFSKLTKPSQIGFTKPILMLDNTTLINLVAFVRVSAKKQKKQKKPKTENSYKTQENIISVCAHAHCVVPTGGFDCITENGGARYRTPSAMKQLLNGPHNVVGVAWISRFLRNRKTWNVLRPLFAERGIQIWSVMEGIGSLTHPDLFNAAVQQAEDEITNHKSRLQQVVAPNPNPGRYFPLFKPYRPRYSGACYTKHATMNLSKVVTRGALAKTIVLSATSISTMFRRNTGPAKQALDGKPSPPQLSHTAPHQKLTIGSFLLGLRRRILLKP
jgi:DNA invertase Pin-like site-specific DNA recombinase